LNRYEMVNIIDVNWGEGETAPAQKMISEEIARAGGTVEDIGSMGRRRLAYPIDRKKDGIYIVSHFLHSPEGVVPLRDSLKLNPAVIRTLLVRYRGQPGAIPREEVPKKEEPAAEEETGPEKAGPAEDNTEKESQAARTPEK